jgi:hypothetical protein
MASKVKVRKKYTSTCWGAIAFTLSLHLSGNMFLFRDPKDGGQPSVSRRIPYRDPYYIARQVAQLNPQSDTEHAVLTHPIIIFTVHQQNSLYWLMRSILN